jgi:Protein of unknown function (DUF2442)
MADFQEAEWAKAEERGRVEMATKPRALSACYDRESGRIVVELVNGSLFEFPARLAQGLQSASDDQLAEVEILGVGFGLHWEALDADHKVESLMAGRFGSARYMIDRFGSDWQGAVAA